MRAPRRPAVPIYVAALFPRMLELVGELADGAILTWPTVAAVPQAAAHLARGAARAGRAPDAVDLASLLPCAVAPTRSPALDGMRPAVAFYAGFFSRYNRLLAEQGFPEEARPSGRRGSAVTGRAPWARCPMPCSTPSPWREPRTR